MDHTYSDSSRNGLIDENLTQLRLKSSMAKRTGAHGPTGLSKALTPKHLPGNSQKKNMNPNPIQQHDSTRLLMKKAAKMRKE